MEHSWKVYVIECNTAKHFYVGITRMGEKRIMQHKLKQGSQFTRVHGVKRFMFLPECYSADLEVKNAERKTVIQLSEMDSTFEICGAGWTRTDHLPKSGYRGVECISGGRYRGRARTENGIRLKGPKRQTALEAHLDYLAYCKGLQHELVP
jgi:predicted GIY-YIG superfamily endonuclease